MPELDAPLHFVCERLTAFLPGITLPVRAVICSTAILVVGDFAVFAVHSSHRALLLPVLLLLALPFYYYYYHYYYYYDYCCYYYYHYYDYDDDDEY